MVGVDASTGLQAFTKVFAGFAPGDPAGAVVLDPANDNDTGPIPVFATPARIEIVEVPPAGVELTSVRGLTITYKDGFATIAAGTPAPAAKTPVEVFNALRSAFQRSDNIATSVKVAAQSGDRLIITLGEHDVDSDSSVSISFNKRMYLGGASDEAGITQFLKTLITVQTDDEDQPSQQPADITEQVKFNADSDAHRITLKLGGALQLGKRYTIILKATLADASGTDNASGLKLGQSKVNGQLKGGLGSDLKLSFTVRKPGGLLATNTLIPGSAIHDMSLNGNLALVAAGNGGVQAFDISDPAKLDGAQPPLSAFINCTWDGGRKVFDPCGFGYWAVASDHHGRIITTGMGGALGSLKTFRISDFIDPSTQDIPPLPRYVPLDKQIGGTPISWTPGINTNMPIGSEILLSDKPEAIPRRVQILLQDDEVKLSRTALIAKYQGSKTDLANGYQKLTLKITPDQPSYQWQTITIENRTLKLRWSVDMPHNGNRQLAGVIARLGR